MRLIVLEKSTQLTEIDCREEAVYIGSDDNCEIRLPNADLAAQIGVFYVENENNWVYEPLDVSSAVQLNGATVIDKVQFRIGDQLKIADYLIRAEIGDDQPAPAGATPAVKRTSVENLRRFVQYRLPPGTVIKKPSEDVVLKPEQRSKCSRAAVKLGQCATIEELMGAGLQLLIETFGASRVWMGVRKMTYGSLDYVEGRLNTGQSTELSSTGDNLKPRVLDRDQFLLLPYGDDSYRGSVMVGPLCASEGTQGMVYVDTKEGERRFETHDLEAFIQFLNVLAAHLEGIYQRIAKIRAAMLEGEVAVAHAIQTRLTPRKLPQWEELQFGAFREMGRERTSDIYDVVRLSNGMAIFMIAHTSAAGAVPGMLMAQAQAAFRVASMHLDAPHTFLRSINNIMYDGTNDHPLDCFVGVIEPHTGNMRFAQAGRMGAFIISGCGEPRALSPKEATPSISATRDYQYKLEPEKMRNGETLALFTPGVVTARNSQGEVFGQERFINILCDGFGQQASSTLREMLSDLQQFTESGTQPDDITVILAHRL